MKGRGTTASRKIVVNSLTQNVSTLPNTPPPVLRSVNEQNEAIWKMSKMEEVAESVGHSEEGMLIKHFGGVRVAGNRKLFLWLSWLDGPIGVYWEKQLKNVPTQPTYPTRLFFGHRSGSEDRKLCWEKFISLIIADFKSTKMYYFKVPTQVRIYILQFIGRVIFFLWSRTGK